MFGVQNNPLEEINANVRDLTKELLELRIEIMRLKEVIHTIPTHQVPFTPYPTYPLSSNS